MDSRDELIDSQTRRVFLLDTMKDSEQNTEENKKTKERIEQGAAIGIGCYDTQVEQSKELKRRERERQGIPCVSISDKIRASSGVEWI